MKVLIVGDIVGSSGVQRLKKEYKKISEEQKIDFCIVNGENSAAGKGLRVKEYDEIMGLGVDCITMGNHLYYRKEMAPKYKELKNLLIPSNINNLVGNGSTVIEKLGKKFAVINIIGKAGMGDILSEAITSPFDAVINEINRVNEQGADFIFVDFHAEATAEKIAMSYFLKDKVTCLFGTHTHVQTADEKIFDTGMAYITDVGMTGPINSVIGLKTELALKRFVNGEYAKYECSDNESCFCAIILEIDDITNKCVKIERINR